MKFKKSATSYKFHYYKNRIENYILNENQLK